MEENISGVTQTAAESETSTPDAGAEFEQLIKGKYKQQYDQRVQETLRKRLKNAKDAEDTLNGLAQKYGITVEEIANLAKPAQMPLDIDEARRFYPGFNMAQEMKNPQFKRLLESGVDVRTAFEVVHRDQIIPAAMQAAARAVERKLTGAGVTRVAEGAMEKGAAAVVKTDVSAMTRQDRLDIIRRAQKGEKIRF